MKPDKEHVHHYHLFCLPEMNFH